MWIFKQSFCLHMKIYTYKVHLFTRLLVYIKFTETCKSAHSFRFSACRIHTCTELVNTWNVHTDELNLIDTHDVFTCSTWFSSLYLCVFQSQRDCPGSPHINPMDAVNHNCGWGGGSVHPGLWCGYGVCHGQISRCYPGCLWWCRLDGMIPGE